MFLDWVGDGYCDDQTNINECNYDGGDCCLNVVNMDFCSLCLCYENATSIDLPEPGGLGNARKCPLRWPFREVHRGRSR